MPALCSNRAVTLDGAACRKLERASFSAGRAGRASDRREDVSTGRSAVVGVGWCAVCVCGCIRVQYAASAPFDFCVVRVVQAMTVLVSAPCASLGCGRPQLLVMSMSIMRWLVGPAIWAGGRGAPDCYGNTTARPIKKPALMPPGPSFPNSGSRSSGGEIGTTVFVPKSPGLLALASSASYRATEQPTTSGPRLYARDVLLGL